MWTLRASCMPNLVRLPTERAFNSLMRFTFPACGGSAEQPPHSAFGGKVEWGRAPDPLLRRLDVGVPYHLGPLRDFGSDVGLEPVRGAVLGGHPEVGEALLEV